VRLKGTTRNINLLNVILIAVALLFTTYILLPVFNVSVTFTPLRSKNITEETKEEKTIPTQVPSPLEYTLIAEQNLFHPERKIPPEKKDENIPRPDFILYGTLISENLSLAYMEDKNAPYSTPGRGKRQQALRLGNALSGYTLKEVSHDRVVMVKGEERIEVKMLDPQHKKVRVIEPTVPHVVSPVSPQPKAKPTIRQ